MAESTADIVLFVPTSALTGQAKPNTKKRSRAKQLRGLYGGREDLVVRTALIRPEGYDPLTAPTVSTSQELIDAVGTLEPGQVAAVAIDAGAHVLAVYEKDRESGGDLVDAQILTAMLLASASAVALVERSQKGTMAVGRGRARAAAEAFGCVGLTLVDYVLDGKSFYDSTGKRPADLVR